MRKESNNHRNGFLKPVSMEFHGEFHDIKFADIAKRENERVSWDARRLHPYETPLAQLSSFQSRYPHS
jgi:hypothetical protein